MKKSIKDYLIEKIAEEVGVVVDLVKLEHPELEEHGDYSTNVALVLKGGRSMADKITAAIKDDVLIAKTEVAGPGFINIWLQNAYLIKEIDRVISHGQEYGNGLAVSTKRVMVEFAHPNTHKAFHIGHLRNITTGESIIRLLESQGNAVIRANYQGDVGMHIAKAIYALTSISPYSEQLGLVKGVKNRVEFLGKAYAAGSSAYEEDEMVKNKIHDYNYLVYAAAQRFQEENGIAKSSTDYLAFVKGRGEEVDRVYVVWKETRKWSLDYFESIYERVGTHYDRYYFESECLGGVDLAKAAVKKGVLEESDGAIIFNGKPYGLDIRVFVNSLGLPTYEGKELALATTQFKEHGHIDQLIHVLGPEQVSFTQVTFKVEELLGIQKGQQSHLTYGWVKLKQGKMSSRLGNVVLGEELLDEAVRGVGEIVKANDYSEREKKEIAEKVAIAAVKYAFLKVGIDQETAFDMKESISLQGNSGPYLQYTFARVQSVLTKGGEIDANVDGKYQLNDAESDILRYLYRFPEIVSEAATRLSPNLLCTFLYGLAQRYNTFYNQHSILSADKIETKKFRLALTKAVGQVIKNGLYLLGIEAPEKM